MNWSRGRKWAVTVALAWLTFCVTFASSILSPATQVLAQEFGYSIEVMVLATALFVLGTAFGPVVWGPLSELYGRKWPMFIGVFIFGVFQIPVAVAKNVETIFVCRFLQGFFGCSPLNIVGGALADFWLPADRGIAVSLFSLAAFLGPTGGPVVGGYLVQTPSYGWRWTAWVTLFATIFFGVIGWAVCPESFGPVLLQQRARRLRFSTRNWAVHAPADEVDVDMRALMEKHLTKPILMLIWEPILALMTVYISFVYGVMCTCSIGKRFWYSTDVSTVLFFEAYPISFIEQRGWSPGEGGLPFIAIIIGVTLGGLVNLIFIKTRYVRKARKMGRVPPEERLLPMMIGSVALPAGLFWYVQAFILPSSILRRLTSLVTGMLGRLRPR
jgi:MFS transporter, DHA1 family, multidrug resistance protein